MKKNKLNDTQIALLIKLALEFNASIIANASVLYNQDYNKQSRDKIIDNFKNISDEYVVKIKEVKEFYD